YNSVHMKKPIVLLTDFGTADPFVGVMKGVIARISPATNIIDLTHEIPPGEIQRAALTLWSSVPYFSGGTIFLVVVDPGVGTHRHPALVETGQYTFVGPDNGVFSFVLGDNYRAWELSNPKFTLPNPRTTFHGRDLFAPVAAYASTGVSGCEFGDPIPELQSIPNPKLETQSPGNLQGEVLYADRFGNTLTSFGVFTPTPDGTYSLQPWTGGAKASGWDLKNAHLSIPGRCPLPWAATFAAIPEGDCAMIVGSSGLLEIAANRQSAAKMLNLKTGDPLTLIRPVHKK
ncbi:MAG: SAM-dependent chlorinase/fluorinase, partial [Anaerolineales bacterium]|nr:SAM-dependent chlorinase/fluorinase [Anaerolineales bacterium]